MAAKSGGQCTIVTEAEMANDEMSGLIINSLEMASEVGLQAAVVGFKGAKAEIENVKNPQFVREGQFYRKLAIFNTEDLSKIKLDFSFKNPRKCYEASTFAFSAEGATILQSNNLF